MNGRASGPDPDVRLTGSSADSHLLMTFGLFGVGMGLVNSQISVAAVSGMPPSQAGLASGIASASRQVGQALGVAVSGSLLTAKAHGRIHAEFTLASYPAWHLLFWCASDVVIAGFLTTRPRARHEMTKASVRRKRPLAREESHLPQRPAEPLVSQTSAPSPQSVWIPRSPRNARPPGEPPPWHIVHDDYPE